ncbi:MAG: peptidoglycan DD-metalloendopeptidase family protein [Kofleriaceae bacterium]
MASDSTFPLIVGVGAGAAALYFWQRQKSAHASPRPQQASAPPARPVDPWVDPKPVTPSPPTPSVPPMPPTQPKPNAPTAPPKPTPPSPTPGAPPPKPALQPQPKPAPQPPAPPKPSPTSPPQSVTPPQPVAPPPQLRGRWVWPVPMWNGRKPVISSGWGSPRKHGPHRGADIMFKREKGDPFPDRTPNGSKWHVMPDDVVAVAASDGIVWSAGWTSGGFAVVIDHGPQKVATFYTHISKLLVAPTDRAKSGQRVYAGQPIGIIDFDPRDGQRLKHLHFELWLGGPKDAVDVAPIIKSWEYIKDPRPTSSPPPKTMTAPGPMVARNASLQYRSIGERGENYPDWVRALDGKSGVYVIREIDANGTPEVVYVGSSQGRLYDTLTRHFQIWRRYKGFWKGQYAEGHDPGLTYDRHRVDVAVRITSPGDALDEEARLIARLRPRDNLLGQPDEEAVPF